MILTASIVRYNNNPDLINSVLRQLTESIHHIKVYIIDNSSVSIAGLLDSKCSFEYIHSPYNSGFGAGHNQAIKIAMGYNSKYHLVINPDIEFDPSVINELFLFMEQNSDVGNVMPLVTYPDGRNQYLAKMMPNPLTLMLRLVHYYIPEWMVRKASRKYELHDLPLDSPIDVPSLSGCFMFLRCDALREAGFFDERFFLYFEDYDLNRRIRQKYKTVFYPGVSIIHHFERASRRDLVAFMHHLFSAFKYFNKWGWFFDAARRNENRKVQFSIALNNHLVSANIAHKKTVCKDSIKSIALISNQAFSQLNFRGSMIRELSGKGIIVYTLAPDYNLDLRKKARSLGAIPISFHLDRIGTSPLVDFKDIFLLSGLLKRLSPDAVFCNFIKPVIYGSFAAQKAGISNIYSMISGLGYLFTDSPKHYSLKNPAFKRAASMLYKMALKHNKRVFFHNPDDLAVFVSSGVLEKEKAVRVFGSGVDVGYYMPETVKNEKMQFILIARLLFDKGIREYAQAAKNIKSKYPQTHFLLMGGKDINPAGLNFEEVSQWVDSGVIEWPGQVQDVRPWLRKSSVFVLPSWREGTPRSTLEAMACGKAIITTDVPGCRETVFPDSETGKFNYLKGGKLKAGINGIMVPVRDPSALAQAMEYMINNPDKVVEMGRQSRLMAEKYYDVRKVNRVIFEEMGIL
ncbi:glycosyltransferase [Desulfonatronovibrio magnus]|uniref:glycosyltransferase n=1 Tax=Desulfonatronovibrio magnus TaxID=698827 RepID=UPI00069855ED|nr:glycosyltransferase [Desulfonatronovibrio magnus]